MSFAEHTAEICAALGNPCRVRILSCLAEGEVRVNDLADIIGVSQSATSQHLSKLREAGLIEFRREAQMIYYRLTSDVATRILAIARDDFDGRNFRAA